jgi:hypothetical protein
MIRNFLFCGAVFMALTGPAMAQEQCAAPAAPTIPDGARATPAQIGAAQNDIKAYAAASDSFQACIAREIERQKALAKDRNTEIDPAVQAALETKGHGAEKRRRTARLRVGRQRTGLQRSSTAEAAAKRPERTWRISRRHDRRLPVLEPR